ncbi:MULTISPECIES: hypothetical protein [Paraburkholderia]|jgi:hypothetical protein|uniref:hypothetical protein n=1 Tax=Paraburkholderia TaxID=1822464 RepID=UPI000F51E0E4|nr:MULTISPECIES: hypothetical protein [Paraburkholderia]MBB2977514.1 hypothetical protein [Paraburkholderia tropica]MBB3000846.1 hypothetical protein [Paraburkholderia tropica]MBB6319366.1 hypothetical protein [Paraburkholderia tropica]MBN3809311.1 hypothetical protein [Paraburkholderia sp. Ac-20347]MDE1141815.1 hypothetical protein [Paraburkholderia tropica]
MSIVKWILVGGELESGLQDTPRGLHVTRRRGVTLSPTPGRASQNAHFSLIVLIRDFKGQR